MIQGSTMFCVTRKLGVIHQEVHKWSKESFGNIFKQKKYIEHKLEELQTHMGNGDISITTHEEEKHWHKK